MTITVEEERKLYAINEESKRNPNSGFTPKQ
jgi:hypothetical protein